MLIGIDVGGTNIDAVIIDGMEVKKKVKVPILGELSSSITNAFEKITEGSDLSVIERVNLSTTLCTNAVVENKLNAVGMILIPGIGLNREFFSCGEAFFLDGYIDHRGTVCRMLDLNKAREAISYFKNRGMNYLGISGKFSVRNPEFELKLYDMYRDFFKHISIAHRLSGRLNYLRRTHTTYLNAAVWQLFRDFSCEFKRVAGRRNIENIFISKADGGVSSLDYAVEMPVETILSGPSASVMGAMILSGIKEDAVILDIGGTTTDLSFFSDGVPLFVPDGIDIGRYKTLIRAFYIKSLGLGGDSKITVKNGVVLIGPERVPPAGFGGEFPTPTDCFAHSGILQVPFEERSARAVLELSVKLGIEKEDVTDFVLRRMAQIIKSIVTRELDLINQRPVYTVKEVLYGKKIQPKVMVIIGGPAQALAPYIEEELGLPVIVPENFEVANAIGVCLSKTTRFITLEADTEKGILMVPEEGFKMSIGKNFGLQNARAIAYKILKDAMKKQNIEIGDGDIEIIEESVFNMVRGFYRTGQIIRLRLQTKPGFIRSVLNE